MPRVIGWELLPHPSWEKRLQGGGKKIKGDKRRDTRDMEWVKKGKGGF